MFRKARKEIFLNFLENFRKIRKKTLTFVLKSVIIYKRVDARDKGIAGVVQW